MKAKTLDEFRKQNKIFVKDIPCITKPTYFNIINNRTAPYQNTLSELFDFFHQYGLSKKDFDEYTKDFNKRIYKK